MKVPHQHFCVLPWVSMETSPIGSVRPCCLSLNEVIDDTGTKFNLGTSRLSDIQNSQHMRDLRQAFLDGVKVKDCQRCWSEEDAGRTSKRRFTLQRLSKMIDDDVWTSDAKPLMFLDLKLGNICNLKCRICGSWSSSTYAAEEIRFQPDKKNNFHYEMLRLGRWPREQPQFWQDLEESFDNIQYLEFTGGEPFMIQEHFDLLRRLVETDNAGHVEIHYNTNGTIWPETAEELWQHFRHVEIAFSIDDVGDRFEYQRSNARWDEVQANIARFRDMRARNSNITLQCCSTVNAFNVCYLEELATWVDLQAFDFVYWNMLHDPEAFCIAKLPDHAKEYISNLLRLAEFSAQHRIEIDRIVEFMRLGKSSDGAEIRNNIRHLDQRRDQRLDQVAPELASLLKI